MNWLAIARDHYFHSLACFILHWPSLHTGAEAATGTHLSALHFMFCPNYSHRQSFFSACKKWILLTCPRKISGRKSNLKQPLSAVKCFFLNWLGGKSILGLKLRSLQQFQQPVLCLNFLSAYWQERKRWKLLSTQSWEAIVCCTIQLKSCTKTNIISQLWK